MTSTSVRSFLRCTSAAGIFSDERVIRFPDASGEMQSAFVDISVLENERGQDWLAVSRAENLNGKVLVALPTADDDRVWVNSADVKDQLDGAK